MELPCLTDFPCRVKQILLVCSVSDVNFDIHSDIHPTIGMETSSSSSGLTNTETGTDTNKQVLLCFNNQGTIADVQAPYNRLP